MLNLISLGLTESSISVEALKEISNSDDVFLESYTVNFPYTIKQLEKTLNAKIIPLTREQVESEEIVQKAKSKNISLLIYGDALSATTHVQLIQACQKQKVKYKIFHSSSILTAVAETELSLYKFGKTSSMPTWTDSWQPDSFLDYIKQNQSIGAHSLLLVDISLELKKAKEQLQEAAENKNFRIEKIILCSSLATKDQKILYDSLENLPAQIPAPYCFVIPGELNETEKDFLKSF